jgi:hypothetical protein
MNKEELINKEFTLDLGSTPTQVIVKDIDITKDKVIVEYLNSTPDRIEEFTISDFEYFAMIKIDNNKNLIDDAYKSYTNYPLATIQDHHTNLLYQNLYKGWCIRIGRSMVSPHPTRHLTQEEFTNKCKTDSDFSERWGLKIEERELSEDERHNLLTQQMTKLRAIRDEDYINYNIPTKLITITYNNKTIESYE